MTDKKPWEGLFDALGEPLDKMPDEISPGTNAILFNEQDEVLLQRRSDNGRWAPPGGRMEIGESAEECVIRETIEETGLTTRIKRLVGVYSNPANNYITVFGENIKNSEVRISLKDILGRQLHAEKLKTLNQSFTMKIDVSLIPNGIYFIEIVAGSSTLVEKISVNKS